ncbi:MAG: hypothetical protein WCK59_04010 [Candidatus Falkowbacteria bacterium]
MKEKFLGAFLALSPFKGNAQEGKVENKDKIISQTEQIQESLPAEKKAIDEKTANPWKVSFETNLSLVKDSKVSETPGNAVETDKDSRHLHRLSEKIFDNYATYNAWSQKIEEAKLDGSLGGYASIWDNYQQGKIDAGSAMTQIKNIQLSAVFGHNLLQSGSKEATGTEAPAWVLTLLNNYFAETGVLESFKNSGDEFSAGSMLMGETLASVEKNNLTIEGLSAAIKSQSSNLSYESKIGALSFLSQVLGKNQNHTGQTKLENRADEEVLNQVLSQATLYFQGKNNGFLPLGECRHLAALVSQLADKGLGLNASEVSSVRHVLVQIKNEKGITLIDGDNLINSVSGRPILSKDDVDEAIVKNFQKPTISDLTIDAGGNKVLYENRHNNFAGLMRKLTNRDNLSLRAPEFLAGENKLDLFPRLSEAGVTRGSIEKGNVGLQAYWLRNSNEYSNFMKDIKGLNLAAYVPAEFSLANKKFENILFANLGFYHSVLELASDRGGEAKTWDATTSIEDYLRCSLNASLTAGMITKLADFNQELSRQSDLEIGGTQKTEYSGSISPFISFEIPSSKEKNGRAYLCSGLEVDPYMALPDIRKLSTIPWFQAGFEYNKNEIEFGLKARGEFQPVSSRFDLDSFLKKGANQFELRSFLELYNQEFKKLTPYQNVAGIEAGVRHDLGNGHGLFLMISAKSDGGELKQVLLNVGFNF